MFPNYSSPRYATLVMSLIVLASYAGSFLCVYWLTHEMRRFMLPALEVAFVLLAISARLLLPRLPLNIQSSTPAKRVSPSSRHHSWLGRAS